MIVLSVVMTGNTGIIAVAKPQHLPELTRLSNMCDESVCELYSSSSTMEELVIRLEENT